jgi:hypothetical protein
MILTKQQKEIIIGSILGDGCLEKNGNHTRLRIEHSDNQKKYLDWKCQRLGNFATKPRKAKSYHYSAEKYYERWHFSTLSKPVFDIYWQVFYQQGKKIIPKTINNLLTSPLSLAVWFMDDGYKRNDCNALRINTDSFSESEQESLQKCLDDNYGIKSNLHKKAKTWNIYIPQSSAEKFCGIVKPYILPSLKYKITLTP